MIINLKKNLLKHKLILLILAILILIQIAISSFFPYLTKLIIDNILLKHQLSIFKGLIFFTFGLILIQIPVNIGVSFFCSQWSQLIIYDFRQSISQNFLSSKENSSKNGLFINTVINDCEVVGNQLLSITLNSIPNVLLITLYIIILFQLNNQLTIITLVTIPIFLLISYITSKHIFVLSKELQQYKDKLIEFLNAHIRNKLLIDLYNLKNEEKTQFVSVTNQVKQANIKTNTILAFLNNLASLITVIVPLFTLFMGSVMVIHQKMTLGTLIAFNSYISLLFTPLSKLLTIPPMYSQMKASIERIEQSNFTDLVFNKGEYKQIPLLNSNQIEVIDLIPFIEKKPLLSKSLSFTLKKGDILRIEGTNGVGKSIILKCLIHYYENFTGTIQIALKKKIAYIPQENFLFEGTIQDNLTKGLTEYDSDKLKFFINLLHFEIPLTQKVTPFTFNLSSGQLQKIKLIRTFLSMPDILIIDEALANLDNSIVSNIVQFIQDRQLTTIIVYHGNFDNYLEKSKYKTLNLSNFI